MFKASDDKQAPFGYCTQCGKPLQADAKFCVHCGSPVVPDTTDEEQESDSPHNADQDTNQNTDDKTQSLDVVIPEAEETNELSVDEVLAAKTAAERSVEETGRISSVSEYPTTPQAPLQNEETQRIPFAEQPTISSPVSPQTSQSSSSFTPGNTAELPVAETLRQTAHQGVSYSAENSAASKSGKGKIIALVVGAVVVVVAVAVALAVLVFGVGQPSQDSTTPSAEQTQTSQEIVVELTNTYSTHFATDNSITYPTFTFKYPSSWSVTDELVTARGETVELTSSDGAKIKYEQRAQSTSSSDSVSLTGIEKVADASFVPTMVQGSDYSDLGQFIVVKGTLSVNGRDKGICYALVPSSAMHSTMDLDLRCGVPGFWYASTITFTCQPPEGISDQTEQEIIAILASFTESKAAASEESTKDNNEVTAITDDYVLPDSSSRLYSESELEKLSNYELYIARNEIFARHGRMFNNEDLQAYFGSKDWYHPTVEAKDFDESVLNSTEKKNIETMAKIENDRGSTFIS